MVGREMTRIPRKWFVWAADWTATILVIGALIIGLSSIREASKITISHENETGEQE